MIRPTQKYGLLIAAGMISSCTGSLPASADTIVTFNRETTGSIRQERPRRSDESETTEQIPSRSEPKQTITVQFKDALARVEIRPIGAKPETIPSSILLYDGMAQKIYTLDPAAKTYSVQSYKEAIDGQTPQGGNGTGRSGRMTFSGNVELKAARANNAFVTKEIGGAAARQYLLTGSSAINLNLPTSGGGQNMPMSSATRPGAPIILGGGRQRQVREIRTMPSFTPPSMEISGEIWSTDGLSLFTAGRDTPIVAIYRLMIPESAGPFGAPITKPLLTRLKNMKSLPGESTISFRMGSARSDRPRGDDALPAENPLTTHLVLKELQAAAAVSDSLFVIPDDYKPAPVPASVPERPDGFERRGPGGRGFGGIQ